MDDRSGVGPPTETTLKNIRRARAHSVVVGPYHFEWKFWTGNFLLVPFWRSETVEFFNEGPVQWGRFYWLVFGASVSKRLPERRAREAESYYVQEWSRCGERRGKGRNHECEKCR